MGISLPRLARLSDKMEEFVDRGRAAGILTLVHRDGEEVCCTVSGYRDRAKRAPLARDTIFRIASMTKPVTSLAALILVEEGRIRLSDPIESWLPEFAEPMVLRTMTGEIDDVFRSPRSIKVVDLLTHCAGLAYGYSAVGPISEAIAASVGTGPFPSLAPDEFARRLGALPLLFSPGTRWNYGYSTDVLGLLIERASGQPLADFMCQRLFDPLDMVDTGFFVPPAKVDRLAVAYRWSAERKSLEEYHHPVTAPPIFASGGAGLVSTADDYMRFARMLLCNGSLDGVRIVSRKTIELITTNFLSPEIRRQPPSCLDRLGGRGFGLGVAIVDDLGGQEVLGSPGKYGWPGAFATAWTNDPQERLVSILMTQLHFDDQREIRPAFENLVYQAIDD